MPALFDLLEKETEPSVRTVLGRWAQNLHLPWSLAWEPVYANDWRSPRSGVLPLQAEPLN
jgi:hypothetical protein